MTDSEKIATQNQVKTGKRTKINFTGDKLPPRPPVLIENPKT